MGGDLVVTAMTVPLKAGAGTSIVVADTTTNQGAGSVGGSTTRFYLSANFQLDASDVLLTGARPFPHWAPAPAVRARRRWRFRRTSTTGSYFLIAKADADGVVAETQEGNNTTGRSVAIGPDLSVSMMTVPYTVVAGSTVPVTETVLNQGAGAAGASTTRFYLSTNITLDAADVELNGSRGVPALAAGGLVGRHDADHHPGRHRARDVLLLREGRRRWRRRRESGRQQRQLARDPGERRQRDSRR